mgnify:CR=1 FL=1
MRENRHCKKELGSYLHSYGSNCDGEILTVENDRLHVRIGLYHVIELSAFFCVTKENNGDTFVHLNDQTSKDCGRELYIRL